MIRAVALLSSILAIASFVSAALKARNTLRPLEIYGQIQIKYSDDDGDHVLYLDSRHYLTEELPADAEITVLGGDAVFDCGGALVNAISGTIFLSGEAKGWEHLYVRQGELDVNIGGKTTVLDQQRFTFKFRKTGRPAEFKGFLR